MTTFNRYQRKHTSQQRQEMRALADQGYAIQYIARKFKCRPNAVAHHVFDLITPQKISKKKQAQYLKSSNLTIAKVQRIRELGVVKKISAKEVGRMFNISQSATLSIINGKTFRWLEGITKCGVIEPIEYKSKPKSDRVRGAKVGSKQGVKPGVLIKYAEKHGVKPTTICRWIKQGKLKVKKNEKIDK